MSHGLVPSKSTVYVSNLPFDMKTNDLHKVFEKYGKIVKVTILKDKQTRKSKGVAFLLFLKREDARKCADETDAKEMFGRTLKASLANDNGRSTEFIRRKNYPNKSSCYECGEEGHMSYKCPRNLLGDREPPPKKVRKRKKKQEQDVAGSEDEMSDEEADCETLSAAIALEYQKTELEQPTSSSNASLDRNRKKIKKSTYFSDEEESSD